MNKSDYIRLNLKNVQDLPSMLVEKSKEFFDIEVHDLSIRVSFRDVSCSHNAPIGKETNWGGRKENLPRNYLGWHGQIYCQVYDKYIMSLKDYELYSINVSAASSMFNKCYKERGFNGFYTGTGCPGSVAGQYKMNIEFYFFLDDFPLLKSIYHQWNILKSFENKNSKWNSSDLRCGQFACKDHIWI